ncbi:MAG TPA: RNA-binding protein [Erysipelotrichaceae bacterium]|nr:RNA-binding protein [Erysipelotrichaceae bacterium]
MNFKTTEQAQFWDRFCTKTNRLLDTVCYEVFYFDDDEETANDLCERVLKGKKRATCSSYDYYLNEHISMPRVGDLSLFTDWEGHPKGVIQTTNIEILAFEDVDKERFEREGEDDTLETWREGHLSYFRPQVPDFNMKSKVVFEDFDLIYIENE